MRIIGCRPEGIKGIIGKVLFKVGVAAGCINFEFILSPCFAAAGLGRIVEEPTVERRVVTIERLER